MVTGRKKKKKKNSFRKKKKPKNHDFFFFNKCNTELEVTQLPLFLIPYTKSSDTTFIFFSFFLSFSIFLEVKEGASR